MKTLTDHLDAKVIQQLQDSLAFATRTQIRTYGSEGEAITELSPCIGPLGGPIEMPIVISGQTLGKAVMYPADSADAPSVQMAAGMLGFFSETLSRLCAAERDLHARVEELATVYRLTALFTGHKDLRHVLDTVVNTVVEAMNVKACGLRLLNRQTDEMTVEAVANLSRGYLNKGVSHLADSKLDQEAFATGDVVYVADERTDPRVLYPAEARREGIVSALIVPLSYKGKPVGALRLYTDHEYRFSVYEVGMVKAIAAQAAAAIVNTRLRADAREAEHMRRQVRLAGEVQRRMIPAAPPQMSGLDLAAVYVPSLELSGDFYDFIELPEGNLGLAICDVMGKGVPAGLLTASIRASLRAHAGSLYDLSDIFARVNRSMCDDTLTTSFATLFYGVINTTTMELTYSNAGHEPPLLIRNRQAIPLTGGGTILGVYPELEYEQSVVQLTGGDVVLFTTDGLIEAMDFHEEEFGRDRMIEAAISAVDQGMAAGGIAQHVLWEMRRFTGLREHGDDVTLVAVRVQ